MTDTRPTPDQQIKLHELQKREAERAFDQHQTFKDAVNKALVEGGNHTLRMAVIINGGAAVTLLAFIGGFVGQGRISVGAQLNALSATLIWFAVGIAI